MTPRRRYCTLFDMAYADKAIAMMRSLFRLSSRPLVIDALAMDQETYDFLQRIYARMPYMHPIHPKAVLRGDVEMATRNRSTDYRCFTTTAALIEHVAILTGTGITTYLDADLFFFSDPELAFDELADRDVGVVPHRFPEHDRERLEPNGLFNVSWVSFRDTSRSLALLSRWREHVLERCDASTCGDQKYLDEWPLLLGQHLCIFQSPGIGLAPWHAYTKKITEGPRVDGVPVVFFHFHEHWRGASTSRTGYPLTPELIRHIYQPYETELENIRHEMLQIHPR